MARVTARTLIGIFYLGGLSIALLLSGAAGIFLSKYYFIAFLPGILMIRAELKYLKVIGAARKELEAVMYKHDDKQYVWDVERTRDKLMARLLQEGVCPWASEKRCADTCPKETCWCNKQKESLERLGYLNTKDSTKKVKLSEKDSST